MAIGFILRLLFRTHSQSIGIYAICNLFITLSVSEPRPWARLMFESHIDTTSPAPSLRQTTWYSDAWSATSTPLGT
jgi:hypothetical protein